MAVVLLKRVARYSYVLKLFGFQSFKLLPRQSVKSNERLCVMLRQVNHSFLMLTFCQDVSNYSFCLQLYKRLIMFPEFSRNTIKSHNRNSGHYYNILQYNSDYNVIRTTGDW